MNLKGFSNMNSNEKDTRFCVKCDVSNCVYHAKDNKCDAGNIEVGPSHSCSDDNETKCKTFIAK